MTAKQKRLHFLQKQISRLTSHTDKFKSTSSRFSRLRLAVFLGGFGLGIALDYIISPEIGWTIIGITLIALNIAAFFHRRIVRSIRRHEIWLELKATQVARMQLDWQHIPAPITPEPQPEHPFEIDLDITGAFSLHHLIDTAISQDGSELLKAWLLNPLPDTETVARRQEVVKELTPMSRFRDKLYLAYRLVSEKYLEGKKLLHCLEKQQTRTGFSRILYASSALVIINIVLFTLHAFQILPAWWMLSLTVYGILYLLNQGLLDSLLDDSVLISEELRKLKAVLYFLERYRYGNHVELKRLCKPFWAEGTRPSAELKRITLISFAVGLRMNPMFRVVLNLVLPWDFWLAQLLNRVGRNLHEKLVPWLEALVELEALNSLASFAYLNPEAVFPKLCFEKTQETSGVLRADGLGHPLIHEQQRKCNDFTLAENGDVTLITGSNMSGKSTFLKTVGVNLVLAFAGGPVIAKQFETLPFRIFTCIQINDSITDGFSFFYTEVRRLKSLLEALRSKHERPLFFLIDEIFKGTNNRERLIGSRSYIQALAGQNGLGIISTHDLELTRLADSISQITNFHFREEIEGGKMVFDYQMRPGPCPSTNALKIMQMEGLPVEV